MKKQKMELKEDLKTYKKAIKEYKKNPKTYTLEEIKKEIKNTNEK